MHLPPRSNERTTDSRRNTIRTRTKIPMRKKNLLRRNQPTRSSLTLTSARRTIAMVPPLSIRMEGSTQEQLEVVRSVVVRAALVALVALAVVQAALEVLEDGEALVLTSTSTISSGHLLARLVVAADEVHSNSRFWWARTSRFRRASPSWMLQRARRRASSSLRWSVAVDAVERA